MSTGTIQIVSTGEHCTVCGEELLLERTGEDEISLSCGCLCASALC